MRAWWLAVSLVGCGDKDDSGVAPLYQYNECESEVAPVLTDLYCESTGLKVYPETGEEVPVDRNGRPIAQFHHGISGVASTHERNSLRLKDVALQKSLLLPEGM